MHFKGMNSHYTSDYNAYDEPELMPQTDALRTFRLNLNDLKSLRVKLKLNPVDPRYAPMKLYRIADLQRACDAKYAAYGGLDALREQKAENKRARDEEKVKKEMGQATRAGELVKLLTDAGVGKAERDKLLAQDCAVNYIKRAKSKATAFDIVMQLMATNGGAGAAAAASAALSKPAAEEAELTKEMGKAMRAGELVKLLTERGLGEKERAQLLAQKCAVNFIKHGKATAFDIINQLMAAGGAAATSAAPVMSTPAKAAPRRAPAATPVKHEHDPEVVYKL